MKVVILAGGFGTRISEVSHLLPKPMIEVGGKPILWHIMKGYSHFGFNEFVICAGYKQHVIKEWFADYFLHSSDVTFDYTNGHETMEVHDTTAEPWRVTVADTGFSTNTAGRIYRVRKYVGDERFMLTYGDGVSDVNPNDILATHRAASAVATLTGVIPAQRFGILDVDGGGLVRSFQEKRTDTAALVNGGFMVCEPSVFQAIEQAGSCPDAEDFSAVTLEWLAHEGRLACHRHRGFWMCMDTKRDYEQMERLWSSGNAAWKVW